ncbi:hypothetical protein GCM10028821_32090 [Hymenobacter jeollabukensis]
MGERAAGQSRLRIDAAAPVDSLVDNALVGRGVRVGNVRLSGLRTSLGSFAIDTNIIGMRRGLLLSTGDVRKIAHENSSPGTSGVAADFGQKFRPDKDLARICRCRPADQVILEFDFVPAHNAVSFRYCFASEEYREFVGSGFDDAFAFVLSGPRVARRNLAVLPGGRVRVAINTVNHRRRAELYLNNDYFLNYGLLKKSKKGPHASWPRRVWNWLFNRHNHDPRGFYALEKEKKKLNQALVSSFEYDGFTRVLTAQAYVQPWQLYHLKLVVADVGDAAFDSGVFLEQGSFSSARDTTEPGFVAYRDMSRRMNWDSIFGRLRPAPTVLTAPAPDPSTVIIGFAVDADGLAPAERVRLDAFAHYALAHPGQLQIQGFTDNTGSSRHNQQLSERRALRVMFYLSRQGVPRSRMQYLGLSAENPVASNEDDEGRAANRRVEVSLVDD